MVDNKTIRFVIVLSAAAAIQGCSIFGTGGSGSFACPAGVDGVRCMSAREVYQATENSDYVMTQAETEDVGKQPAPVDAFPSQTNTQESSVVPTIDQPIPIRSQAGIMRIWMAPWEDDAGDLHADGYLYTEIEGRRWNLGSRFKAPRETLVPLNADTGGMVHE